jgi:hypothetical protein
MADLLARQMASTAATYHKVLKLLYGWLARKKRSQPTRWPRSSGPSWPSSRSRSCPRRPSSGCSRPAEKRADKAPEKTVEGLRRVGVVLYDVDPDQLACIAGGQQATSLHGHCGCPNGCNQ